ncbi:MAG: FAD-dependent oxidoreductase [Pseudobdellovibrionaceae bacterium]
MNTSALTAIFGDRFLQEPEGNLIRGIIYPENFDELKKLVVLANKEKTKLHVVSSGKNWGFGESAARSELPYFIVNLKRMNRILEFNKESGYVVLEPGVTYSQLYHYLQKNAPHQFIIDAQGSSMEASVIGNTLERGHGQTPSADHIANACNFEILLGNSKILRTGFGRFEENNLENLDKWGLGPSYEGLFSQSNFGIVTRATIWLLNKPEATAILQISFGSSTFLEVTNALHRLRLQKVIQAGPHFANIYFLLSRIYRLEDLTKDSFLSFEKALEVGKKHGISEWTSNIVIHGCMSQIQFTQKKVLDALKNSFESSRLITDQGFGKNNGIDLPEDQIRFLDQISGRLGGTGISRMGWRKNKPLVDSLYDLDLEKEEIGVICTPIACPSGGSKLESATRLIQKICEENETEPFMALFVCRDRLIHIHSFLLFNRNNQVEVKKHSECAEKINLGLKKIGLVPHRLGANMSIEDYTPSNASNELINVLKNYFDPNGIFVDSRYVPSSLER